MIGSGVFTTSGYALADHGRRDVVLFAWVIGGLLATFGALSYGALARRIPESGGEYTFLSRTVHPLAGFLAGWISLLAGFTAPIAAAALGMQAYLLAGTDADGADGLLSRPEWLGTGAIAIAALIHGLRLREGLWIQNLAIGLKLVAVVGFLAIGFAALPDVPAPTEPPPVDPGALAVTLVWISFAYTGWNAAVYVAGEVRDPDRNLVRSLLLGTGIVTLLYLGLNAIFLFAAPIEELAGKAEVGAIAAEAIGGPGLRRGLSGIIALALFTSVSSLVMIGPRIYARMAREGRFPRWFSERGEVPSRAILLQAALSVAVVWIANLRELLGYIGFTLGLCSAATVIGLMRLRIRQGAERVPVVGFPWIPGIYVAATLWIAIRMAPREPDQVAIGLLTVASGLPVYWILYRSTAGGRP